MLGANPANAATSLLYTGEMYDSSASMYYLRKLKLKKFRFLLSLDWLSGGRFYWTLLRMVGAVFPVWPYVVVEVQAVSIFSGAGYGALRL